MSRNFFGSLMNIVLFIDSFRLVSFCINWILYLNIREVVTREMHMCNDLNMDIVGERIKTNLCQYMIQINNMNECMIL